MHDKLEAVETTAVEELERIGREQDVLRERVDALEARRESVSGEVYSRVSNDYGSRMAALEREAEPLRATAGEQLAELQALLGQLREARRESALEREELELRHTLGEYEDGVFTERLAELDRRLASHEDELAQAEAVAERFRAVVPAGPVLPPEPAQAAAAADRPPVGPEELEVPAEVVGTAVESTASGAFPAGDGAALDVGETRSAVGELPDAGLPSEAPSPPVPGPGPAVPTTSSYATGALEVARFVGDGVEHTLQLGTTTIGRAPKNDIRLRDASVSREHAKIVFTERGFAIYDLGSENGVWVNGERVKHAMLSEGDVVEFGPGVSPLVFRGP